MCINQYELKNIKINLVPPRHFEKKHNKNRIIFEPFNRPFGQKLFYSLPDQGFYALKWPLKPFWIASKGPNPSLIWWFRSFLCNVMAFKRIEHCISQFIKFSFDLNYWPLIWPAFFQPALCTKISNVVFVLLRAS